MAFDEGLAERIRDVLRVSAQQCTTTSSFASNWLEIGRAVNYELADKKHSLSAET
ncbi:hypothetical protein [Steroidobacter agaridevorans]|uniref:hypothetical protein n=1 Tax=Steroidobacter agaridevorans TaxID=2695856 RepID=UPI001379A39E|nr:hypothetical protein [Steroidobacter agaridevorans]